MNSQVNQYLQHQLSRAPALLRSYTQDEQGNTYLTRNMYSRVQGLIDTFVAGEKEIRVVSIPGLRGVGKTTLLAQLYLHYLNQANISLLYISADQVVNELKSDLYTVLDEYQHILGDSLEKLDHDVLLLIDEIHFDKKWTAVLKSLYDRSKRVFVVCTGSSALSLQSTTDLARRVVFEKMYPMSFTEYILLKTQRESFQDTTVQVKKISQAFTDALEQAVWYSQSAQDCFDRLSQVQSQVQNYWLGIDSFELDRYLRYKSMPYALTITDEQRLFTLTNQQIDRVVEKDLPDLGQFDTATLASIKNILLMLAGSSEVSLNSLANSITGVSLVTVSTILDSLEKAEMLIRVYPYGSTYKKVRKPSKYHFMTPAVRHALLTLVEGDSAYSNHKAVYLEDCIALILYRELAQKLASPILYDNAAGGADFILVLGGKKIVLEVGFGTKNTDQVETTLQRIDGQYGLVVSNSELAVVGNVVKVPLVYFLLI